jgi:hypothetical protein
MTDNSDNSIVSASGGKPWLKEHNFKPGQSGNPNGRPKGSISLQERVRRLLEDEENLPEPVVSMIRAQCGSDKRAIDAVFIVGLLQALQGDKQWAQFITERGWGKVPDVIEGGDPEKPIKMSISWESADE